MLGDNIFFGHGLPDQLRAAASRSVGATVFAYHVNDPQRYGVVTFDKDGTVTAGNASGINDGAAAVLLAPSAMAKELGKPLAPKAVRFVGDIPRTRNAKLMRRVVRAAHYTEPLTNV